MSIVQRLVIAFVIGAVAAVVVADRQLAAAVLIMATTAVSVAFLSRRPS